MRNPAVALLVAVFIAAPVMDAYAAHSFPHSVTIPSLPIYGKAVDVRVGESEFILRDKTEVHRGKVWLGYLAYQRKWGPDKRLALERIVDSLKNGGWEVMMIDGPRQPPLATLRLTTDDNRVLWASVEVAETARLLVLEQDES